MTVGLIQLKEQKNKLNDNKDFAKRINKGKLWQALGRFKTVRRGYSILKNQLQQ